MTHFEWLNIVSARILGCRVSSPFVQHLHILAEVYVHRFLSLVRKRCFSLAIVVDKVHKLILDILPLLLVVVVGIFGRLG